MQSPFEQTPLLAFSPGTVLHLQILREKGEEVLSFMASSVASPGNINGNDMSKAHGLFWLWVLGAYEVVRTMSQASSCFSEGAVEKLGAEKQYLAKIRIPFAKQELEGGRRGKETPEWRTAFATGINPEDGDITFTVEGECYSAKASIERFWALISSISLADIKKSHGECYGA